MDFGTCVGTCVVDENINAGTENEGVVINSGGFVVEVYVGVVLIKEISSGAVDVVVNMDGLGVKDGVSDQVKDGVADQVKDGVADCVVIGVMDGVIVRVIDGVIDCVMEGVIDCVIEGVIEGVMVCVIEGVINIVFDGVID